MALEDQDRIRLGNQVCLDVSAEAMNCRACGTKCAAVQNGTAGGAAGKCGVAACNMGFDNCNQMVGDGCEVNLNTDGSNCGKCSTPCGNYSR